MKAISSEGKLPFGIGGIKVSVAKIDGKVLTETLYINRQRSSNVYDLINDNGDIYITKFPCVGMIPVVSTFQILLSQ